MRAPTLANVLAIAVAGLCVAISIGCQSPRSEPANRDAHDGCVLHGPPEWYFATPTEPGTAFYGVGHGAYKLAEQKPRAIREADAQARRQLATAMWPHIERIYNTHLAIFITEIDGIYAATSGFERAFTNVVVQGAEIVRRFETHALDANGLLYVYSLAAINLASIADILFRCLRTSRPPMELTAAAEKELRDSIAQSLAAAQRIAYPNAKPLEPPVAHEYVVVADAAATSAATE